MLGSWQKKRSKMQKSEQNNIINWFTRWSVLRNHRKHLFICWLPSSRVLHSRLCRLCRDFVSILNTRVMFSLFHLARLTSCKHSWRRNTFSYLYFRVFPNLLCHPWVLVFHQLPCALACPVRLGYHAYLADPGRPSNIHTDQTVSVVSVFRRGY